MPAYTHLPCRTESKGNPSSRLLLSETKAAGWGAQKPARWLSQPWPRAPWQVTHSPHTPSVTEAAVITPPNCPSEPWRLLQLPKKRHCNNCKPQPGLQPAQSNACPTFRSCSQLVISQHVYVLPKVLQVYSPQAEGDVQPHPERLSLPWLSLPVILSFDILT